MGKRSVEARRNGAGERRQSRENFGPHNYRRANSAQKFERFGNGRGFSGLQQVSPGGCCTPGISDFAMNEYDASLRFLVDEFRHFLQLIELRRGEVENLDVAITQFPKWARFGKLRGKIEDGGDAKAHGGGGLAMVQRAANPDLRCDRVPCPAAQAIIESGKMLA